MKPWLAVIAALILASGALIWWLQNEPPPVSSSQPAEPATEVIAVGTSAAQANQLKLEVTVIDDKGQPVSGALVSAQGRSIHSGRTDAQGHWQLAFAADDAQIVSAEAGELTTQAEGPIAESMQVVLQLKAPWKANCSLVDSISRAPVMNARVSTLGRAFAVEGGQVALSVAPANTPLHVDAPGYLSLDAWVDFSHSTPVCVLTLERISRVEGSVIDNGVPVSSVVVWAESVGLGGERSAFVQTNNNGEFSIESRAGVLRLVGNTRSGLRVEGPAFALAAGETKKGLVLELGARASVTGTLTREGAPMALAEVALVNALTEQQVATTRADVQGRYRFNEATASRYVLQIRLGTFGGIAGPFAHGETETKFDFNFSGISSVKGHVEPATAGVRVRCRDSSWTGSARDAVTDAMGRFTFEGISGRVFIDAEGPAGAATATAMPGDDVVLTLTANALLVHVRDGAGQPVTDALVFSQNADTGVLRTDRLLAPSGDLTLALPRGFWLISAQTRSGLRSASARVELQSPMEVSLSLPPGLKVSATVVDAVNHLPISGASVSLYSNGSGQQIPAVVTDARGAFTLTEVDANSGLAIFRAGYKRVGFRSADVPATVSLTPDAAASAPPPFQYEGVGMVLEVRGQAVAVRQVYEGSPAQRAGALADDIIRAVDGAPAQLPIDAVLNKIRGSAGSQVTLTLERNGRAFDVVMRRRAFVL